MAKPMNNRCSTADHFERTKRHILVHRRHIGGIGVVASSSNDIILIVEQITSLPAQAGINMLMRTCRKLHSISQTMAIRTISVFQSNYLSPEGCDMLNVDISGFSPLDFFTRSDHSISAPTISTPPDFISTPTLISPDSHMSGVYSDGITGADVESVNADMTAFDSMEDDQQHSFLDSPLSSMKIDPPVRIESSRHQHGLGISGLRSKDGNGPFTGLGLFSVHPSPWRNTPTYGDSQHDYSDKAALSNSHRYELCDAAAGAVQAQTQTSQSFLKYDSESSDMFHIMIGTPNHQSRKFLSRSHLSHRTLTPPQLVKHFSAPPVLNDLKEMSPRLNEHCRRRLGRSAYISRRAVPSVL